MANVTCKTRDKGQLEKSRISCHCGVKKPAVRHKLSRRKIMAKPCLHHHVLLSNTVIYYFKNQIYQRSNCLQCLARDYTSVCVGGSPRGATPFYGLYKYVRPQRVYQWFISRFVYMGMFLTGSHFFHHYQNENQQKPFRNYV